MQIETDFIEKVKVKPPTKEKPTFNFLHRVLSRSSAEATGSCRDACWAASCISDRNCSLTTSRSLQNGTLAIPRFSVTCRLPSRSRTDWNGTEKWVVLHCAMYSLVTRFHDPAHRLMLPKTPAMLAMSWLLKPVGLRNPPPLLSLACKFLSSLQKNMFISSSLIQEKWKSNKAVSAWQKNFCVSRSPPRSNLVRKKKKKKEFIFTPPPPHPF